MTKKNFNHATRIKSWQTLHRKTIFKDHFKHLEALSCQLPDGREFSPYYIDHYPDWVNVVALTPQKEFILVKQYRHAYGEITIETAAGTLDPEETDPLPAARRELYEETGYVPGNICKLDALAPNPALQNNLVHIYLATDCKNTGSQHLDTHEIIEVVLIKYQDIYQAIQDGMFKHALALVAILMALLHIEGIRGS